MRGVEFECWDAGGVVFDDEAEDGHGVGGGGGGGDGSESGSESGTTIPCGMSYPLHVGYATREATERGPFGVPLRRGRGMIGALTRNTNTNEATRYRKTRLRGWTTLSSLDVGHS
jgi:hypothetical protein